MITLERLQELVFSSAACSEAKAFLRKCRTIEEAMNAGSNRAEWAYWLRRHVWQRMTAEEKTMAEEIALESPMVAYWLRLDVPSLSEDAKRKAEAKALETPETAFRLRRDAKDLSEETKRAAEEIAGESPAQAFRLRVQVKGLSPDIKRQAELMACKCGASATHLRWYHPDLHPDTIELLDRLGIQPCPTDKLNPEESE